MTDLEHPHIIRMIASFTGLDFGKIAATAKNLRAVPTGRRRISKRNTMRDDSSQSESSDDEGESRTPLLSNPGLSTFGRPSPHRQIQQPSQSELEESPVKRMMG